MHDVQIERGPRASTRGLVARVGVVVIVVALLGAGLVAVQGFGSTGGSDSPQQAVEELLNAVGQEDMLGAAELVEPAERRTLVEPAIDMVGELKRLRVLADDFDLSAVSGIDFEFTDMTYAPEVLGPGVTRVRVDGAITASGDVEQLRLGDLVLENVPAEAIQDMQDEAAVASTEALDDVGIVTVERDGRWYVSLWYSLAEAARRSTDEPLPRFGDGPVPVGGETPEDAVRTFATEAADLDLGGVIAQLDPEETAALYDYATLFIDDADAAVAELLADDPTFAVTVDRLDLRSQIDGDDAVVWVDGVALSVTGRDGHVDIDTAADCLVYTVDEWNPQGQCEIERSDLSGDNEWGIDLGLDDLPSPSVRAHRVDDRWYLSPTASLVQPSLEVMRILEADQLKRWIDDPDSFLDELPDVLATAPESAGLAVAGVGGIYVLGLGIERQFNESSSFELAEPPVLELEPPPVEFEIPPVVEPPVVEQQLPALVSVWVTVADIPAGTSGEEVGRSVSIVELPIVLVPDNAVVDLSELYGKVVTYDVAANQILDAEMFIDR